MPQFLAAGAVGALIAGGLSMAPVSAAARFEAGPTATASAAGAQRAVALTHPLTANDTGAPAAGLAPAVTTYNPSTGSQGFAVFIQGNATLGATSVTGPVAMGGNLTVGSNFTVASQTAGTFTASGDAQPTGLLIGGSINWAASNSGGVVNVGSSAYVKVGNMTGSVVPNNGGNPTHVAPTGSNYGSKPQVALAVAQPTASVNQSGLINFSSAFSAFTSQSANMATCANSLTLTNSNGTPLSFPLSSGTNAYVTLTAGTQNVLNISAANLANISTLTFNNSPTATMPLIINVNTSGVANSFSWTPGNFNGVQSSGVPYMLWNFSTATAVTIAGASTVPGTIYAPGATVNDNDQNGLNGGVIAAGYAQGGTSGSPNGGQVQSNPFAGTIQSCSAAIPQLSVSQTSYVTASPTAGSPVTYAVSAGVSAAGASEGNPVSVTETTPSGVLPVGAYGSGWTCGAPSGQTITCTDSAAPFAAGTSLPALTVEAIVTGSSVTAATVQSSSTVTASSSDGSTGTATSTTAGTVPTAPSGVTVSPVSGTIAGGNSVTVSGTNISGATAIEIGTTAQQQAGTPVVLLPCPGAAAAGCFTVSGSTLSISSMPSVTAAETAGVTVVTLGASGSAGYAYTSVPGTPAAPTATAGITSAAVSWTAPASNNSPITGYIVTPYLGGVAQTPVSYGASTTTQTLTGLTAGGSYTFTVAAVNAVGTGAASPQSAAVTPYALPGAPVIGAVSAGDSAATVNWTAPASNGAAITGYVVTPYIGGVAQAAQTFSSAATTETATGLTPGTSYTFKVAAVNAAGTGPASAASAAVTVNAGPGITSAAPPAGEVSVGYSDQLTASGGTGTLAWSASGSLPPGLSLSSSGLLSGTPTTAGSYAFTVKVSDAAGGSATQAVTMAIAAVPTLANAAPPAGQAAVAYSDALTVTGGTGPFTWSVSSGSLPPGLTLNAATGVLSGTPTTAAPYSFTVRVTDSFGLTATQSLSVTIAVGPLVISATATASTVAQGATIGYTVTITNTGASAYSGVTFTVPLSNVLDDAAYNANAAATAGTVSYASPNLTWTGNLAAGAAATITFSVTVSSPYTGNGTLAFTVTSATTGTNCAPGSTDSRCAVSVPVAALTITQTASTAAAAPGAVVGYTITVTNSGLVAYTGATFTDPLAGVLGNAAYNANAAATAGTVSYASSTLTWSGNLAAGATATITFSVTINSPDAGSKTLSSTITSATAGTNCPSGGADPRCTATVNVQGLTIASTASTASTTPGATVQYTVTITNSGQAAYTGASITDSLAGVLDDAAYNGNAAATAGSLSYTSPNLTWTGSLAVGASVTITFSATVNNPDTGDKTLVTAITSATPASNCPASGPAAACGTSVTVLVPALTIVNSAGVASTTPGSVVRFTVTITNSGQTPYAGISVADSLAGVLDDAAYDGDAAASAGAVSYASPTLTWTGSLAAGAAATVTFSATVNAVDTGDKVLATTVTTAAAGSDCPAGSSDARCSTAVPVLIPGLTLTLTANTASATAGSTVAYTVTAQNTGQTADTGVSFTDSLAGVLDDAAYNGNAAASAGTVSYTSPNLTWTGTLAAGATATVTFSVTVSSPDTGNMILSSAVTSAAAGSNCPAGGTAPACSATVTVAQLTIVNTANVATTTPGSVVRYTSTFTNTGQTPYSGITVSSNITDVLDDATPNGDQTATSGTLTLTGTGISWTGSIPVGGTVTVTGTVTVDNPDTGNKVMNSTLTTAAAGSNCPAGGTDPRCTATVDVLLPGLTIVKTADASAAVPGQAVGYTVTITDSGQTPYTGAVVTDTLGGVLDDAAYDGDAAATAGAVSYAAPVLTWTGSLSPGGSATITYTATVNTPDTGDHLLVNTVSSTAVGSSCPPGTTSSPCQVTVPVLTPGLTIVQSASSATAVPGQTVTYTITVTDSGQTPYAGAALTESLAGVLGDAAYDGDAAATAGSVSYAAPVLAWTGSLSPGGSATITYSVTVDNPDTGGHVLAGTVTSPTAGSNCPAGGTAAACTATVTVSQLTIVSTPSAGTVTPGAVVTATTTITNTGQTPYFGISVSFASPNTAAQISDVGNETASSGTLSVGATGAVWTGDVPVGATVTLTGGILIANPYPAGGQVVTLTGSTTAPGSNCPAGSADPRCTMTVDVVIPGLTIVKTADASAAVPGQAVGYTVTITDSGQTPYSGAVVTDDLTGVLDDATYDGDAAATSGSVSYAAPALTWTGSLAVGQTATLTYSVTVDSPDNGDKLLVNTVTSSAAGSSCPPGATSGGCQVTVPVLTPGLTIVVAAATTSGSDAVATPGGVVSYTITVTNTGQVPYTGAALTDPLGGVLDDAAYDGDAAATAGSVSYAAPNLTWTGNLAPGASATITYSVTVSNPDTGNQSLTGTVVSATAGSNCPAGGTDARCSVTVTVVGASTLTFTQTAAASSAVAGGTVAYTITVANSGASPYIGAAFTDPLGGVLDDAAWDGDAAASSGTVTFASPVLSWAGDVPANGTVTITYTVTVNNPDTGDKILASTISSSSADGNCPAAAPGPRCTATVTVSQLTIDFAVSASTVSPGGSLVYTATLANTGQTPYYGISVSTDTTELSANATSGGEITASSGTLSVGATGTVWTGNIPVGATVTITSPVLVDNPVTNDTLTATAVTAAPGSNCPAGSTDPRCTPVTTVLTPGLTITKTADASAAVPGQAVGYTITITDSGQTPYAGAVVTDDLSGVLDDAAYDGDAAATIGAVSYAAPSLTWTGSLAPGDTATITYTVTVSSPDAGDHLLVNTVASSAAGSTCPPGTTSSPCQVTVPVLTPALTIAATASTASAVPGQTVTYTVTVTDSGQTPYTGAALTDPLAGVLGDAAYNGDAAATAGSVSYAAPNLTWTGSLAPGATATITYTVTVDNPDTGGHVLAGTITSPTPGSNCGTGSADPRCATMVAVSQLTIVSAFSPSTVTPGGTINETTTIANAGQTPYYGISVAFSTANTTAQISDAGNETASSGTLSVGATGAVWTGDVPVGATVTITGSVIIADPYPAGGQVIAITDSTAAPGSNCPAGSADPRCTATANVLIPGLTISNAASTSDPVPGQVVGYTLTITDTGQTAYTGVTVTDSVAQMLDDVAYDGDAAATSGALSYAGGVITWTGSLAPGDTATVTFTVTVDNPDTGDKTLVAAASSSAAGSTCPPGTTTAPCRITGGVLTPALTITSTAGAATTVPGATVGYTLTIANTGQIPYTAITLTDDLTGLLDDAAYNGDAVATAGAVSYTAPALTWTGSLNPGDTATITFSATVSNPDTGDDLLSTTATSAAAGNNCPSGSTDPICSTSVPVAVLTMTNTPSTTTATPGSTVGYTITVANTGQVPIANGTVTVPLAGVLDDAGYDGDAAATTGTVSFTSPDLTWTGTLAVGATATITFSVTVNNPDTGDKTLTDTITSTTPGATCPASGTAPAACTAVVTVLIPGLTITQAASAATTTPGSTVGYTITVADTGQTPYTGATITDDLTSLLDDTAYNHDAAATSGALSYTAPVLAWTGNLAVGATATITFSVTVNNPDTGDKDLTNTVTSTAPGSTCPPADPAPACSTAVTDLIPALTITKTASTAAATPGSTVGYTITVTDSGQTPYTPATVTDDLTGVLADAAYNRDAAATTGSLSYAAPALTWTGNLTPGQSATITYSATTDNPGTGPGALDNTATSADPGSTCPPAGTRAAACTATLAITPGPLTLATPAALTWAATLTGQTQPIAANGPAQDAYAVSDDTGAGAGWTITAQATPFTTTAGTTLPAGIFTTNGNPADATSTSPPTATCTPGTACTPPTPALAYPIPIPIAANGTTPAAIYQAAPGTGTGATTISNIGWWLTIPATTLAGTYTSTITLNISSGP